MGERSRRRLLVLAALASLAIAFVFAAPVGAATGGGTVAQVSQTTTTFALGSKEVVELVEQGVVVPGVQPFRREPTADQRLKG